MPVMNQTKKRLSIIKLAISITDIETIQLQILKLTPMKTDNKIQEILSLLQSESYAQAQALITTYIETEQEEILQRSSQKESTQISTEDQDIIDEFKLFVTPTNNTSTQSVAIDINDFPPIEPKITKNQENADYDSLLNLGASDVLSDNIDIDISHSPDDSFFLKENDKEETLHEEQDNDTKIPKDTFFDTHEDKIVVENEKEPIPSSSEYPEITVLDENDTFNTSDIDKNMQNVSYPAMAHIGQKFTSMKQRYPLVEKSYAKFDTVDTLLAKIETEGYSETEIEEMITYIKNLSSQNKYMEAAQLLLVCGATESKFAQFMLARELYKGKLLTQNIAESFNLMHTLSLDDYAEAHCDLGQFYENGIGTSIDLQKAEDLYKEAANLGIKRAKKHYDRLKKQNKGFFKI
jgi:hypothetical protein